MPRNPHLPTPLVGDEGGEGALRVLVIDDEPDILVLCRVNLESAGHQVIEAADGEQGLALAARERPDLILLDVMLPARDGLTVLRELGRLPATRGVPVVMLTAKAQIEDQIRGWADGAAGYVTKPFSPLSLTKLIEQVHRMSAEERRERREAALADLTAASS